MSGLFEERRWLAWRFFFLLTFCRLYTTYGCEADIIGMVNIPTWLVGQIPKGIWKYLRKDSIKPNYNPSCEDYEARCIR